MQSGMAWYLLRRIGKKDGLCTKLSIRQNLALPNLDMICNKLGVIRSAKEDQLCEEAVRNLRIKTPNVEIDSGIFPVEISRR